MVGQRLYAQAFRVGAGCGADHDFALVGVPGIARAARFAGRADEDDDAVRDAQRLAQYREMAVVERLETADENQIVEAHGESLDAVMERRGLSATGLMLRMSISVHKRLDGGICGQLARTVDCRAG